MLSEKMKLVIVDDEVLIRELLKVCINWEELGVEIVGEASDALEAIELVDSVMPDIVLTDVCMPFMDGIELGKCIIEKYPNIRIVILTGYDEFEYAKRSIKVGISDFLLKPINEDEIIKVISNIIEKILAERLKQDEYTRIREYVEESLPFLREKCLNELISGDREFESLKERLLYYNLNLINGYFQTAVIGIMEQDNKSDTGEEERLLHKIKGIELVKHYFRIDVSVYVFFDNSNRIVILCNDKNVNVTDCCEEIKVLLINKLKCFVNIGIGKSVEKIDDVRNSYICACQAQKYKVVLGKNQVINYRDIDISSKEPFQLNSEDLDTLSFLYTNRTSRQVK